jgi:hypothetical protein
MQVKVQEGKESLHPEGGTGEAALGCLCESHKDHPQTSHTRLRAQLSAC